MDEQLHALLERLDFALYTDSDRGALKRFRCAPFGDKPGRAAQKILRTAPERLRDFGAEPMLYLAKDRSELVGAVLFGPDSTNTIVEEFAMGVALSRQREGIGTLLAGLVLSTVARREDWPDLVGSRVHRENYKVIGLDEKLGLEHHPDPTHADFLITARRVAPA